MPFAGGGERNRGGLLTGGRGGTVRLCPGDHKAGDARPTYRVAMGTEQTRPDRAGKQAMARTGRAIGDSVFRRVW